MCEYVTFKVVMMKIKRFKKLLHPTVYINQILISLCCADSYTRKIALTSPILKNVYCLMLNIIHLSLFILYESFKHN